MAGRNCDDSVQILSCCDMTCLLWFVMLPSSVSSLSNWILFRSRDDLQIKCTFVLGVQRYLRFAIGAPPTFFRADSVTLNTPHTSGKSDKIIFTSNKIIGTLNRIVGRGEIGPKSARLSCGVHQHK